MKSWYEIYKERMNETYNSHVATKYGKFIEELYKQHAFRYAEIGCGAGNITKILREMQQKSHLHLLVDSCPKMLSLALENNPSPDCTFKCGDARQLGLYPTDVIHSHGLLEHFSDEDIRQIVKIGTACAPIQIHYVPGAKYLKPSRGDERLMTVDQWNYILKELGKISVSTFNNDYDIILKIEV